MAYDRENRSCSRRFFSAVLVAVTPWVLLLGCTVDFDATDSANQFSCLDDSDCLQGFMCCRPTSEPGVCCTVQGPVEEHCVDLDQDGFLSGPDCPASVIQDCNDDPNNGGAVINPSRTEACNGIDDDCDDETDEDVGTRPCALQSGVCANSVSECIGGDWLDCEAAGVYGPDFENVSQQEETCDGIDNNCSGGYDADATPEEIDMHCTATFGRCIPGLTPPSQCNVDTGVCTRGIRFCSADGILSPCVSAEMGETCDSDADCGDGGFCVSEVLDYREDLLDGCILGSEQACRRQICRHLVGSQSCSNNDACGANQACLDGACQSRVSSNVDEDCNGMDDDCNGRIDDGADCGRCPYNMTYLSNILGTALCVDTYEASRPDATEGDEGLVELYATSRPDVMPWTDILNTAAAEDACRGSEINERPVSQGGIPGHTPEKRLCTAAELEAVCGAEFPYGDSFVAGRCNDSSTGGAVEPTDSYADCCTPEGVCDLAGNAGELVASPTLAVFGGTAGDATVSCDFEPIATNETPDPSIGFRCCTLPLQ